MPKSRVRKHRGSSGRATKKTNAKVNTGGVFLSWWTLCLGGGVLVFVFVTAVFFLSEQRCSAIDNPLNRDSSGLGQPSVTKVNVETQRMRTLTDHLALSLPAQSRSKSNKENGMKEGGNRDGDGDGSDSVLIPLQQVSPMKTNRKSQMNQQRLMNDESSQNVIIMMNESSNVRQFGDDGYFYANDGWDERSELFEEEMKQSEQIARDLLTGNRTTFEQKSRYFITPSKWREFQREYMIKQWEQKKRHLNEARDLHQAHPRCPIIDDQNQDQFIKTAVHFAHNCCKKTGPPHARSALTLGQFDIVKSYNMTSLDSSFNHSMHHILSQWRGAGYWLWKPWIILDTLTRDYRVRNCDVVCYADTGSWYNSSGLPLWSLTSRMTYGVLVFNHLLSGTKSWNEFNQLTERWWSKRDALIMLGLDHEFILDTVHRKASFLCVQKNPDSVHFISEWLFHSMDYRILTDSPNELGRRNHPGFKENRHDQTVLSLLSKKYGIPALTDPSQYAYPDLRRWGSVVKHWDKPWVIKHTRGKQ